MAQKGRKKLTPLEKLYYARIEKIILLGVWIGKTGTGSTDKDVILHLCKHMDIKVDDQILNQMWGQLSAAQTEFREVLRHVRPGEKNMSMD